MAPEPFDCSNLAIPCRFKVINVALFRFAHMPSAAPVSTTVIAVEMIVHSGFSSTNSPVFLHSTL